uniref:RING-type domain-containing protein n=1 Tax=Elaeophora elaphi TaxID=1147741 RepID=A0A0R3RGW8_9BILA
MPEVTLSEIDDLSYLGVAPEAKRTVCLASNCFSVFDESCSRRLNWKYCESQFCSRQLSAVWLERLPCKHNICLTCMEEYKQLSNPVCPVEGCSGKISEVEESNQCDGPCKKHLEEGKYVTTKCCQARICFPCFETIFGRKHSSGIEEKCPSTECLRQPDQLARCQSGFKCKNLAIIGFPSKDECEHAICMQCLEQMIDDCESVGTLPRCPNESCSALYSMESVIAIRTMLPGRSSFFNKLSLDNAYYYIIKDETITVIVQYTHVDTVPIKFSTNFKSVQRYFEIDIRLSDGSESKKLPFDRIGTIADLVREIRRELNIAPEEKVYGYYLTRSLNSQEKTDENVSADKPAEKLEFTAESINETVEKLNLSAAITIVADMAGIVQVKPDVTLNGTGI